MQIQRLKKWEVRKHGFLTRVGQSNHMQGNKDSFVELDEGFRHIKLGNNTKLEVTRKGNIKCEIEGVIQTITDVFFVTELTNNLLSVGQLQNKGVTFFY